MQTTTRPFALALVWLLTNACSANAEKSTPPNQAMRQPISFAALRAEFQNPDMIYAPFAFWFWDEPLNPDKMAEMARTMAGQRLNPGYAQPMLKRPATAPSGLLSAGIERNLQLCSAWGLGDFSGVLDYTTHVQLPAAAHLRHHGRPASRRQRDSCTRRQFGQQQLWRAARVRPARSGNDPRGRGCPVR